MRIVSAFVLAAVCTLPIVDASAARQAAPTTGRQALAQSGANAVKAGKHIAKGGKWAAIGTIGAAGAVVVGAGAVGFLTRDAGAWFNPAAMEASLRIAKSIGTTALDATPHAATLAGIGAGAYVAAPTIKYAGGKAVDAWQKGGLRADVAVGAIAAGTSLVLGNVNPEVVAANGLLAQYGSMGARMTVNGAKSLVTGKAKP